MSVADGLRLVAGRGAAIRGRPLTSARLVLGLARVEGRRLLRHPLFLTGIALTVLGFVFSWSEAAKRVHHSVVEPLWPTGFPVGFLAVFGFTSANVAATRDRLSDTEELFGTTPVLRRTRTAALLLATAWPTAVAAGLLVSYVTAFAVANGVSLGDLVKLSEEPLIVVILSMAGVAMGRWLTGRVLSAVAAFFALMVLGVYAHPVLPRQFLGLWVIPDFLPSVGWHILYLVGLGICVGTIALMKDGVRRSLVVAGAVGVAAIVAGAFLQLPASCPGPPAPCVFR